MTTVLVVGILLAGLIGFMVGVIYQADKGPDYDDHE
jgi:preprotein translocase subunit Sss1